jgi:D-tyrosyl-tRNA(Tyr) deacylase
MKVIVQRVSEAKVIREKDGDTVGKIGKGLMLLVGFKKGDTEESVNTLADKIFKLRVMSDTEDKMNLSVKDSGGKFLIVSQFTLYADTAGGNRPSFINAEEPSRAKELYELFIKEMKDKGAEVETGSFGDYMKIQALLDGPVTILYSESNPE